MIDLHGHLCYGVDDGPRDRAEALALATALKNAGVTTFACTSHIRPDKGWINDKTVIAANLAWPDRTGHRFLDALTLATRMVAAERSTAGEGGSPVGA